MIGFFISGGSSQRIDFGRRNAKVRRTTSLALPNPVAFVRMKKTFCEFPPGELSDKATESI